MSMSEPPSVLEAAAFDTDLTWRNALMTRDHPIVAASRSTTILMTGCAADLVQTITCPHRRTNSASYSDRDRADSTTTLAPIAERHAEILSSANR